MNKEFLKNLKVGDKVLVSRDWVKDMRPHKIHRETKTMWILENGERFRKDTGREIPFDEWHSAFLEQFEKPQPTDIEDLLEDESLQTIGWKKAVQLQTQLASLIPSTQKQLLAYWRENAEYKVNEYKNLGQLTETHAKMIKEFYEKEFER